MLLGAIPIAGFGAMPIAETGGMPMVEVGAGMLWGKGEKPLVAYWAYLDNDNLFSSCYINRGKHMHY